MYLPLSSPLLPALRRIPLRRQRFLSFLSRRRLHFVCGSPLRQSGRWQRREFARKLDLRMCGRYLGTLFPGSEAESTE